MSGSIGPLMLIACLAVGCSGEAAPDDGAPTPVSSVLIGGLLAVDVQQSELVRGFRFLNPQTGKVGPLLPLHVSTDVNAPEQRGPIAFSPEGTRVVFATTEDGLAAWTYGSLSIGSDGAPVYNEEARFSDVIGSNVVYFNAAADRFYTARGWYDPSTGRRHECALVPGNTAPAVLASPDGRHHLFECDGASWLYDDHTPLSPAYGTDQAQFSADGQLILFGDLWAYDVHDRALRLHEYVPLFGELLGPSDPRRTPVIDERNDIAYFGWHGFGETVRSGDTGECYRASVAAAADPLLTAYDLVRWAHGDARSPAATAGAFDRGLIDFATRYDGGTAIPVGRSVDGTDLLFAVTMWTLELTNDFVACEVPVLRTSRVVKVDLETNVHQVATSGELAVSPSAAVPELGPLELIHFDGGNPVARDLPARWPFGMAPALGAVELAPGSLLAPASGGLWGLNAAGESLDRTGVGRLPTADGRFILGAAQPGPNANGTLCATSLGTGARRCLEDTAVRQPWGFGGQRVPGITPADPRATVMHLQPTAAFEGQEVHVFGVGFGDVPGRLTVGGREVRADAIVRWTDGHVTFRMHDALDSGHVLVEGPRGADDTTRPFFLTRTVREPTPWAGVEIPPIVWQQGVQRVVIAGLDAAGVAETTLFGGERERLVADGDGFWIHRQDAVEEASARWTQANRGLWLRQYEERHEPGLAPLLEGGWQVVGKTHATGDYEHFEQLGGVTFEMGSAVGVRRDAHGGFLFDAVPAQGPALPASLWGLPRHPHLLDDGTLLAVRGVDGVSSPSLMRILDFEGQSRWGYPRYDESFRTALPLGMEQVVALGEVVLVVGRDPFSATAAGWIASADGGRTFAAAQSDGAHHKLAQGVAVASGPLQGFLVVETSAQPEVAGLAHFTLDGTVTWDAVPIPPGSADSLRLWADGTRIYAYAPELAALRLLDTTATPLSWQPVEAPSGQVVSAFLDRAGARLLVATAEAVYAAPLGAPPVFTELARPSVPFGAQPQIRAVSVLPDGTVVLRVTLVDTRPGAAGPSPIQGYLVRPPG